MIKKTVPQALEKSRLWDGSFLFFQFCARRGTGDDADGVVQIFRPAVRAARLTLAVERPVHVLRRFDFNGSRGGEGQHGRVVVLRGQREHAVVQLQQILRLAHEQQLKHAVVHVHQILRERQNSGDRRGIADRTEDILILQHPAVVQREAQAAAADIGQLLDAAENVSQMTQGVLDVLRGGIGCARERAEGGDIGKIPVVETADVQPARCALDDVAGGLDQILGKVQTGGKVVGASGGQIANGGIVAACEQAGNGFVEGAVAAGADYKVKFRRALRHDLGCVAAGSGDVDRDVVAAAVKDVDHVRKGVACLLLAGAGVQDQKQFFHGGPHNASARISTAAIRTPAISIRKISLVCGLRILKGRTKHSPVTAATAHSSQPRHVPANISL